LSYFRNAQHITPKDSLSFLLTALLYFEYRTFFDYGIEEEGDDEVDRNIIQEELDITK
jgi:hypothetical protein